MKEKEKKAKEIELKVLTTEEEDGEEQHPKDPPGTGGDD